MIKKNQKQLTEVFIVELKQQPFSLFLFSTLWLCFCLPKWPKYFLDPFCGCYLFIEATECDFFSLIVCCPFGSDFSVANFFTYLLKFFS